MSLTEKMEKYLVSSHGEAKSIVRELCGIPAPTGREGNRAKWCKAWLRKSGARNVSIDEVFNVICEYNVTEDNDIVVFMAHMDTVFPDSESLPFEEKEGLFYSPGVTDDTGNLASLMIAFRYLLQNKVRTDCGIVLVADACEEGLGNLKGCRKIMEKYGSRIKEFIAVDGTKLDRIVTEAVGSHRYEVIVRTEGGHSFASFGNRNAIVCLSSIINALYGVKVPEDGNSVTTYNVGIISGGTSVNSIAEEARMVYEYRSTSRICLDLMEDMFVKVLDAYRAMGIRIEAKRIGSRPCSEDVDNASHENLIGRISDSMKRVLGRECERASGSSDANIPLSMGIPAVCISGAVGGRVHTREEWLDPESLLDGSRLILDILTNYFS